MGLIDVDEAVEHFRRVVEATENNGAYNEGFADALEFCIATLSTMPATDRWIPVSERMPENEATVLVTVAPPGIEPKVLEMSYSNGHWYRNNMLISPWWVVVAWRPMPKPYFKGVLCGEAFEEENESKVL